MTNSNNNSDYNTPSTDLYDYLPQPYRSDTNRALFSNLFNRFLTKSETTQVIGYIGDGTTTAIKTRQIKEPTVHRQGYQLQNLLYAKIGSVEYITSWEDIENELTAQGVDVDQQPIWNNATIFNWAPPIDINKLVNYTDYYWVNPSSPNSQPQYISVKSECSAAISLVNFQQYLINLYGSSFLIKNVQPASNALAIAGNYTQLFEAGFVFFIENSTNPDLNNTFETTVSSSYDASTNLTTIIIQHAFADPTISGTITLNEQLNLYESNQSCRCSGAAGWDTTGWDDSQSTIPPPVWDAEVLAAISYPTLAAYNTAHPTPQLNDIWYNTTTDTLFSLEDASAPTNFANWKDVYNNFSLVLLTTTGTNGWDAATGCSASAATIDGLDQWITQNNWVHKNDVQNFTIAQRAQAPIIEYEPNIELNEWTQTTYTWEYRSSSQVSWFSTTTQPTRLELEPINLYAYSGNEIVIDERYGDMTNVFVPGFSFLIAGTGQIWSVQNSFYRKATPSNPLSAYQTHVIVTATLPISPMLDPSINVLQPEVTSQGDPWKGYGQHWLFIGANATTAINHQPENDMMDASQQPVQVDGSGLYSYQLAPYAEQFTVLGSNVTTFTLSTDLPDGSTRSLQQRALVGFDDIRVYLNDVRQYGTYDENGTTYVTGITFHLPLVPQDIVIIQVGEAAFSDFGNYAIPVRTYALDSDYASFGNTLVSLIELRLVEQVKSATNQYPLFDIYYTNSSSADIANNIFGYHEDPSGVLYPYLSARVVTRSDGSLEFVNNLVQTNNGRMYAYRNYNKIINNFWFNPQTNTLYVWTGKTWSDKFEASGYYTKAIIAPTLPDPSTTPLGFLVFNTTTNTLWVRSNDPSGWTQEAVTISNTDQTLETVWRHGLNNEQFVPARVDWLRRSYPVYQDQYNSYITTTTASILQQNPSLTEQQAEAQANDQWTAMQMNYIQPEWYTDPNAVREGPLWVGEWQNPDTLYFNVSHENYQYVSLRDVLSHFQSIVNAQPLVPGFHGQPSANWNLIDYTQINWGLGGTIHEYDNSFDTFLSAEFINTVTPSSLFGFAQSEYENIIVTLNQTFQKNAVAYLTTLDTASIQFPDAVISDNVIFAYEENEAANLVYGDSTTYQQQIGNTPAVGVQNWIATLPFFHIVEKVVPHSNFDEKLGINEVVHHDGHRAQYSISAITINALQSQIVNTTDPRFPTEKLGRARTTQPPSTQAQFISQFSSNLRTGVYWLDTVNSVLYRVVAFVQPNQPPISSAPNSLWWKTGDGSLWQLISGVWTQVSTTLYNGATVEESTHSAWEPIDLNVLLADIVLTAEQRLYQAAPPPGELVVDFAAIQAQNPTQFNTLLMQQFINYTIAAQIGTPFANNTFDATNPFTWNYKYSTTVTEPHSGVIPSGGTWQDVYQKTYGTPYPHLEPWALQGYVDKPLYWDATFANNNEDIYGIRRWKYVHALPIVTAAVNTLQVGTFGFDQSQIFRDFTNFTIYTATTSFTYTVQTVTFAAGLTTITIAETLDPSIDATCTIAVGMWDYVVRGAIANGNVLPPTMPLAYSYTSVNISSSTFIDGNFTFGSDDLFPPYWNVAAHTFPLGPLGAHLQDKYVRSIFTDSSEVVSENTDYLWQDAGPVEWKWRQSTNYLYSLLVVAYLMQPVRTIQETFGINFEFINGLPIDSLTGQVFSHQNTQFHGEMSVTDQLIQVNGINQWYINYCRAHGFDTSYSDFRAMWTSWTAPLSHLFASTIDTSSFSIDHRIVEITSSDYQLAMKRSPGASNTWIDAFNVRIQALPPIQQLFDNESQWLLEINSLAPISRTISYYDVKCYDYYADPNTSVCTLYTYPVIGLNTLTKTFTIDGDVSEVFGGMNGATQFQITGSIGNNGTYNVVSSTFNPSTQQTAVVVSDTIPSVAADGLITALNYRTLPWTTGQLISVDTTGIAPQGLDTSLQYFIIVKTPTTFQIANTLADANANNPIIFSTPYFGIQKVGQTKTKFQALDGQTTAHLWSHYELNTTIVKKFATPFTLSGMQNFVNIIDGYVGYVGNQGFQFNVDNNYVDPQTGQPVSWDNEIQRFINWAYTQRFVRRQRLNDKYSVAINYANSQLTYTSQNPAFVTGSQVVCWSFGGGLPPPLRQGVTYYIINNGTNVQLANTRTDALAGTPISLSYSGATGQMYLSAAALYLTELPTYELNAFRNALWYSPQEGIVSNLVTGPFVDINSQQILFDQYGRKISPSDIRVFRQDKITEIQFAAGIFNDKIILQDTQQNPYLYLHLGGGNIFVDTFEHTILFNNYTVAGVLLYDPFLGVNVTKYELDYYKQDTFTERPNVGGYFLSTNYNQGANLDVNMEQAVQSVRYLYDNYKLPESSNLIKRARALLGYPGSVSYLEEINLTPKSQFLFWLGSLKYKGSVNAINAFINSIRFVSANVDQFWAYKLADFGSSAEQNYLSMFLTPTDTQTNDLRLEFIQTSKICKPGYAVNVFGDEDCGYANPESGNEVTFNVDPTFTPIVMTDQTRWWNQPDQVQALIPDGGVLYFNLKTHQKLVINTATLGPTTFIPYGDSVVTDPTSPLFPANLTAETAVIVYDPTNTSLEPSQQHPYTFWYWNPSQNGFWVYGGGWDPSVNELPIFRHNFKSDLLKLTMNWYNSGFETHYTIPSSPANVKELNISPYLPLTNSLQVFKNGTQLVPGTDYVESLEQFPGSSILGYKLYFQNSISGSTLDVVYGPSLLNSETQFLTINTNIVQLLSQEFINHLFTNNMTLTLWGLETDVEAQNPAKIIDEVAESVLTPVTIWDPARGYQYYQSLNSIDIQSNDDPAIYDTMHGWKNQEVGKIWLDTTNVQYVPYYDPYVLTDQNTRLDDWGVLTDFGKPRVFQWVASDVAPAQWNALAAEQQGDNTIPASTRKSGTVRQDVRYQTRANTTAAYQSTNSVSITSPSQFAIGSQVMFTSTDTLPTGLAQGTKYTITGIVGNVVSINATMTSAGSGVLTMVGAVWANNWTLFKQVQSNLDPLIDAVSSSTTDDITTYTFYLINCLDPTQDYGVSLFSEGQSVNIYVNGKFNQAYTLTGTGPWPVALALNATDRVSVILPVPVLTDAQLAFDPTKSDDGTTITWYQYITNYNAVQTVDTTTNQNVFTYYFWVENVTTAIGDRESPVSVVEDLVTPPSPYMFFNKLEGAYVTINPQTGMQINVPDHFTQAIVRGLRGYVDDTDRYVLRFTRDFTLRDSLKYGTSPLQLKDKHQEWLMFRQSQLSTISRKLWDKITESMVGFELSNSNVRVPSLDRQLYDAANGTSTQYGLGEGQAFVNGDLALATIEAYLNNPTNNFYPVDLDQFLETYNFDTAANIITTMDAIYNQFSYTNVNNMFFSVMQDALTTQHQYAGLMKTSAVALYGVELLNVNGVFDD